MRSRLSMIIRPREGRSEAPSTATERGFSSGSRSITTAERTLRDSRSARPWSSRRRSFDDGRLDNLAEQIAVLAAPRAGQPLRHPHDHHLLLRIDPERRPGSPTPAVFARGAGHRIQAGLLADGEAEP